MAQTGNSETRSADNFDRAFLSVFGGLAVVLAFAGAIYFVGNREYGRGIKAGQEFAKPQSAIVTYSNKDRYKDLVVTLANGTTTTLYGQKNDSFLSATDIRLDLWREMNKKREGLEKKLDMDKEKTKKETDKIRQEYQKRIEEYN